MNLIDACSLFAGRTNAALRRHVLTAGKIRGIRTNYRSLADFSVPISLDERVGDLMGSALFKSLSIGGLVSAARLRVDLAIESSCQCSLHFEDVLYYVYL